MVADFKFIHGPRALVKVPGSGQDQGAAAPVISCDLGRVSSLAATIPVNPCLPAFMTRTQLPTALPIDLTKTKLATSQVMTGILGNPSSPSRRRPMNSEAEDEATQESKRPWLGMHTSMSATNHRVMRGNVPSSHPVVVPARTQSSGGQERPNLTVNRRVATARRTRPRPVPSPDYRSKSIEELLEEQRSLREENRMLQQQLRERERRLRGIVL